MGPLSDRRDQAGRTPSLWLHGRPVRTVVLIVQSSMPDSSKIHIHSGVDWAVPNRYSGSIAGKPVVLLWGVAE